MSETVRKLAALNQAARAMNAILDPDELVDTILSLVSDVFRLDGCALLLQVPGQSVLTVRAARGYPAQQVDQWSIRPGEGLAGQVFASGDPLLGFEKDSASGVWKALPGIRSEMAAPISVGEEVMGVLVASSRRPVAFQESDLDLFRIFANQATTAIRNARLVRSLEDRSRRLEEKVSELALLDRLGRQMSGNLSLDSLLDEVLSLAHKALHFDHCAVLLKESVAGADVLVVKAAHGYRQAEEHRPFIRSGEGITGRVLMTGEPLLVPDVQEFEGYIQGVTGGRCEMAAPLVVRGEVIGVLDAEAQKVNTYDRVDLRLFSTFASWAAVALHNAEIHGRLASKKALLDQKLGEIDAMNQELRENAARLASTNAQLEQRVRELETLQETSRTITSSLDLEKTLQAIVDMTREIVDCSSCAIRLLGTGDRHGSSVNAGQAGEGTTAVAARNPIDLEVQSRAAMTFLAVPLKVGDKVIGYFELASLEKQAFSADDHRVLQVLASQAAIAIENARLFEGTQETYYETIRSLAQAIEARDAYTRGHSDRVTRYALGVAEHMGLPEEQRRVLRYAGLLHDIGKIGISDTILNKQLRLSRKEWDAIRSHPRFGDNILGPIKFLRQAQEIVLRHHESFDGTGYPGKLSGEEIPIEARIISVADAFDAMTSDRPYRNARSKEKAMEELKDQSGRQFDPTVVDAFAAVVDSLMVEPESAEN